MKKILDLSSIWLIVTTFLVSCTAHEKMEGPEGIDYRQEMRNFVTEISNYARNFDSDFIVIPQNAPELITNSGKADNSLNKGYLDAIGGIGFEDLFYGGNLNDDETSSRSDINYHLAFLNLFKNNNKKVMVIDYCETHWKVDDAYQKNNANGFISFAAPGREMNLIPDYPEAVFNENESDVTKLSDAKNFLFIINTDQFQEKGDFLETLQNTNYDLLLIDLFFDIGGQYSMLTSDEINLLKTKANGGRRLVIGYMSIGEAEDYRWYWDTRWISTNKKLTTLAPSWLEAENPDWVGNFKVKYWHEDWKRIILGSNGSYLDKIIAAGFDGVYLDIVDGFNYFEEK
ncbi:endo alpha-1,4 polygalactosaminidase [candidate division KSB1 bacterium]|nr:endo alpha-1,4 polygalactosaminidase [candidate division KSB1 bacterium]